MSDPLGAMLMHLLGKGDLGHGEMNTFRGGSGPLEVDWRGRKAMRDTNKVGRTRKVRLEIDKMAILFDEQIVFEAVCTESIIESYVTYDVWEVEGLGTFEWYSDHMARAAAEGKAIGSISVEPRTPKEKTRYISVYPHEGSFSKSSAYSTDMAGHFVQLAELWSGVDITKIKNPNDAG